MRIGYDAKRITHNSTGLGNYSRYIVDILSKYYPENQYLLYTPGAAKEHLKNKIPQNNNITYKFPQGFNSILKSRWRSKTIIGDLSKDNVDIFHGLSNELPFGINKSGIPSIVTIHDLIFLRYPEFYKPIDRKIYNYKFKRACVEADKIIAVSEMTKNDIIKYYGIDKDKIVTVYQGCDESFAKTADDKLKEEVKSKYSLPDRYILNVGTIESRKNLLLLIKSLNEIDDKEIKVVVVGRKTPYFDEVNSYIIANKLQDRIVVLSGVTFRELPSIYQMASLFVYPSYFEGFGIPIIEAINSGVPVIGATGSCLEEAGGEYSVYVDPDNPSELAMQINKILSDSTMRMNMINNGLEYVKRFRPEVIASDIMSVYDNILSK